MRIGSPTALVLVVCLGLPGAVVAQTVVAQAADARPDKADSGRKHRGKRTKKAAHDGDGDGDGGGGDNVGADKPSQAPPAKRAGTPRAAPAAAAVDPIARARARENLLRGRAEATEERARAHALATFRLARRREAEVLTSGRRAAETARALEAAVVVLRRSAWETAALRKEVVHATRERAALEKALAPPGASAAGAAGDTDGHPREESPATNEVSLSPALGPLALRWPARGTIVSGPGLRRDPATGTEAIAGGVEILSRMNEPAVAIAPGKIRAVIALPQGGHAVVIAHDDRRISIVSGLRVTSVAVDDQVIAGQNIGFVGRDLDGAPVIAFELWQAGEPIDPRPYLAPE